MFEKHHLDAMTKATAYDANGDKLGRVGQIYADNESGEPTFVTVKTGLFGSNESFVPLQGAKMDGDDLRLAFSKDQVKDAPHIAEDGELDPREEERLYAHYGLGSGTSTTGTREGVTDRHETRDGVAAGTAAGVAGTAAAGTAAAGHRDHDASAERHAAADRTHTDKKAHGDGTIVAHEERLNVEKEQREAGRARIRKYVTTETEHIEVPVQKEKLVVEREAVSGKARPGGLDEHSTGEQVEEITLREERAVVGKETVESERVRVGTETVTEKERIEAEVKKEHIDVDGDHAHGKDLPKNR